MMITAKNGNIIFKNRAELNIMTKDLVRKEVTKVIEQAKRKSTEEALLLLLPIACTSLYEAYGFAEKRQEKFIEYFITHMQCIEDGVTDIGQYKDWCKQQGYKYFDVVEVSND